MNTPDKPNRRGGREKSLIPLWSDGRLFVAINTTNNTVSLGVRSGKSGAYASHRLSDDEATALANGLRRAVRVAQVLTEDAEEVVEE